MQKSPNSDIPVETLNPTRQGTGAVQMRIKNANSHHDRLSQSKSMILTDAGKVTEPISRHRRNHSQHVLKDVIPPLEQLMVEKEGYLQKAKIADGGKKLRRHWRGKTGLLPGLFFLVGKLNFTRSPSSRRYLT
uniref:Uncharacterized protein n=1 Tax=Capra hircus TaxID=9925 RepID=A0A8C2NHU6_CAPHI